jgi:hypothetical protein
MVVPSLQLAAGSHRPDTIDGETPSTLPATRCTVTDNGITVNRSPEFREVLFMLTMSRNLVTFLPGPLGGVATGRGRTVELVFGSFDAEKTRDESLDTLAGPDPV